MDSSQHSYQETVDKVFGNSLIVKRICSYIESRKVGLSLRLVNRLFQEEGSKRLRDNRHDLYSVVIKERTKMKDYLDCMKSRHELGLSPSFPFSSFKFGYQNQGSDTIREFCKMSNGQIRRLHLNNVILEGNINEVVTLLSHSEKLVEIQYTTSAPHISPEELSRLPNHFQDLRVLSITYSHLVSSEPHCFLAEFILKKAPGLEKISCPVFSHPPIPDIRILRIISETHSNNLPVLCFQKQFYIFPSDIPMIEEWMAMSLRFSELNISLCNWYRNTFTRAHRVEIADMKRVVSDWLRTNSSTLTLLELDHYRSCTLRLPPLETLQEMTCQTLNSIENLDQAHFPGLKKLSIRDERGNGLHIQSPMGSVETLELYCTRITNQYLNFPNLTYLEIIFRYDSNEEHIISSIGIMLTNFPLLVHLNIVKYEQACLWNVLTGSAPLPPSNFHQFETSSSNAVVENAHEEEIPSLRNLRALKTLELKQISVGTLDAILYMTDTRQLVPLDNLTLDVYGKILPQERDQACYHHRLARIHKDVKLKFIEDYVQSGVRPIIPLTRL